MLHGIYRQVQFPASPNEDLIVAWLTTGSNSVISHEIALYLYRLSDMPPSEIHVIIPRTGSRRRKGIRLHSNRLNPGDITQRKGLPVTSASMTFINVAASGLAEELIYQAVNEALRQGFINSDELISQASHRGGRFLRINKSILTGEHG